MDDSPLNTLEVNGQVRTGAAGDVPEAIRRRYFAERTGRKGIAFFVDARIPAPAFRDDGKRLSSDRNDPHVVRDLVAIARHRGWGGVAVRGQTDFRREVWLQARRVGLEVRGYSPTARDHEDLARRGRSRSAAPSRDDQTMRIVEAVVRNRVVEPAEQSRILAAARTRLATWLERSATAVRKPPERAR